MYDIIIILYDIKKKQNMMLMNDVSIFSKSASTNFRIP